MAGEFSADGAAQEPVFIEDTYLCQVPWVDSQGDRFADVGCKRCRDVAEVLEVNAVRSHLTSFGHMNQQQVELLQRFRHSWQKAVGLPALNGRRLGLCVVAAVVDVL